MPITKSLSKETIYALRLMSALIFEARTLQGIRQNEMAERLGIGVKTYRKMEKSGLGIAVETYLEALSLLGVQLFQRTKQELRLTSENYDNQLKLLPRKVRVKKEVVFDDNF